MIEKGDAKVKTGVSSCRPTAETLSLMGFNPLCPHCWEAMRTRQGGYRCSNCSDRDSCCESGL